LRGHFFAVTESPIVKAVTSFVNARRRSRAAAQFEMDTRWKLLQFPGKRTAWAFNLHLARGIISCRGRTATGMNAFAPPPGLLPGFSRHPKHV
jgi:hypothetical protein